MSLAFDHSAGDLVVGRPLEEPAAATPVKLKGRPLLGVLPQLRADPLRFFTRVARDHGDVVELSIGLDKMLMLNSPALIRHVLQDNRLNYEKSKFYDVLRSILGDGIFLAEGEEWLSQRKTAGRSFQGCQLRRMTAAMQEAVADLEQRWSALAARRAVIDVIPEMMRLTLDILLRTLFSLRLEDQHEDIFHSLTVILRDAEKRIWSPLAVPRWLPTRRNRAVRAALADFDRFVLDLIAARRAAAGRDEAANDLLDLLLANQNGRSDRQLCGQIQSMILAGHETTANALTWCWYLLSLHPETLRRVRGEARAVLCGRAAGFAELPALKYTRMVFDETLRLYPPLWTFSRTAVADDRIAGLDVPAGTNVMLNMFAVHRRPELWDNPEGFDPARFDTEASDAARQRFAYFPFSDGPRTCLGERFAVLESMIAISAVVQRFELQLLPGQKVEPEPMITLRPRGPLLMRVCPAPAA
ncbi:cytochrome P450 [Pelagibius marinus]|uniref:cytochrome P450 n=1 Tax=Pelagibius marinus TaxID=2762760 RepID=UPI00187251CC|nr:cytochrome P450 [Pelagibius marinus]